MLYRASCFESNHIHSTMTKRCSFIASFFFTISAMKILMVPFSLSSAFHKQKVCHTSCPAGRSMTIPRYGLIHLFIPPITFMLIRLNNDRLSNLFCDSLVLLKMVLLLITALIVYPIEMQQLLLLSYGLLQIHSRYSIQPIFYI